MAFKFTIGKKIGAGFALVILFTLIAFIYTNIIVNQSKRETDQVVKVVTPSVTSLEFFHSTLQRSQILITKWYHVQSKDDDPFKQDLRELIKYKYPALKKGIDSLSVHWTEDEKEQIRTIFSFTDQLFKQYQDEIMSQINSFSAYDDASIKFPAALALEAADDKLNVVYNQLNQLINSQKNNADLVTHQMFTSFDYLMTFVKLLGIFLVIGGILIAFFTIRTIVKPVQKLKNVLQDMSFGVLPKDRLINRSDEIGDMNMALNGLVSAMELTTDFAKEVGSGNFDSYYKPLSDQDNLGHALLKMRTDLAENEHMLEQKVIERTEQVVKQSEEIKTKNNELEILYKHITDSIRYAKRLQEAIIPTDHAVRQILPQSFVLFKPKDIVSGDFYWIKKIQNKSYIAAIDCTGHGVPGAFMSLVGYNILKEITINSNTEIAPSVIMDKMSKGVVDTLNPKYDVEDDNKIASQTKDGMDMGLCCVDYDKMELQFSGAFNPLYLIRNGELIQYKADKFPVGVRVDGIIHDFTNNVIQLQKGDTFYIFSDGYADQFGGPKGKKFMTGNFRTLLKETSKLPIEKQKDFLNNTIENWRGEIEQVDDVLVIGVKV
ncbi:MAG TPA: SpoIIE family protein phosphatase [Bacteroidia bacterium]|nr:SpoIIE family protein phosphatase [Bacteroidia bacterium]